MRHPSFWLALLIAVVSPPARSAGAAAIAASAQLRTLSQAHAQLQSQQFALAQGAARYRTGDQNLHAQLGKILSELPDQVRTYGAAQSDLGVDDGPLIRRIGAPSSF